MTDKGRAAVGEIETELMAMRQAIFADLPRGDIEAALRVLAAIKTAAADEAPGPAED